METIVVDEGYGFQDGPVVAGPYDRPAAVRARPTRNLRYPRRTSANQWHFFPEAPPQSALKRIQITTRLIDRSLGVGLE